MFLCNKMEISKISPLTNQIFLKETQRAERRYRRIETDIKNKISINSKIFNHIPLKSICKSCFLAARQKWCSKLFANKQLDAQVQTDQSVEGRMSMTSLTCNGRFCRNSLLFIARYRNRNIGLRASKRDRVGRRESNKDKIKVAIEQASVFRSFA